MILYKLTDSQGQTRGGTQWGDNITHKATGKGAELCSAGFIHAYEDPLIAVLLNPIHGNFSSPKLWQAEGEIVLREHQLKCGCKSLKTICEIPLPIITTEQKVLFAIACALEVYDDKAFAAWAQDWRSGKDRSEAAAWTAAKAAETARVARAAAWAAARLAEAELVAARAAEAAEAELAAIDIIAIAHHSIVTLKHQRDFLKALI